MNLGKVRRQCSGCGEIAEFDEVSTLNKERESGMYWSNCCRASVMMPIYDYEVENQ